MSAHATDTAVACHGARSESSRASPMVAALYLLQSTAGKRAKNSLFPKTPPVEQQRARLLEAARDRGWRPGKLYIERLTGQKQARPAFERVIADARAGRFDVLVVWSSDCLAARARQAILALAKLHELGIEFLSCEEGFDTSSEAGKEIARFAAALANLEYTVLRESSSEGLHKAMHSGTRSGRPVGRPRRTFDPDAIVQLRAQGWSLRRIAEHLGLGVGTVVRTLQEHQTIRSRQA